MVNQKGFEQFIKNGLNGQSYGLAEAFDKYVSGRLACESPNLETGEYGLDFFEWISNDGRPFSVAVRIVSKITLSDNGEDVIESETLFII